MYELFFEDSLRILGYGLFLAVPLYVMAFHFQDRRLWIGCGVITATIVAALLVEWYVVTPREEVQQTIRDLADLVEQNDVEGLLANISPSQPEVRRRAEYEMPRYDFSVCNVVTFHGIQWDREQPDQATADFMVRFNVSMQGYSGGGFRDVILKFQKESDDQWRIVDYSHFDPLNRRDRQSFLY